MLSEVTTANITETEDLIKHSHIIVAFRGTQKVRKFALLVTSLSLEAFHVLNVWENVVIFTRGNYSS